MPAADRASRRSAQSRDLEAHLPGLADKVLPEAVVTIFVDELEAGLFVEVPGGVQHAVRPEAQPLVAGRAAEGDALGDELLSDPEPPGFRLDQQETQLRDRRRLPDGEHATDVLTVPLRDPAPLARGVEMLDELPDDPGDEALELLVPPVLLGVEGAVALHDPAVVARSRRAQDVRAACRCLRLAQEALHRPHGPHETLLVGNGQARELRADVVARPTVERAEHAPALLREPELRPPGVGGRRAPLDQAAALERGEDPAEIAGAEPELADELLRDGL